jgi:hypothetical protein
VVEIWAGRDLGHLSSSRSFMNSTIDYVNA